MADAAASLASVGPQRIEDSPGASATGRKDAIFHGLCLSAAMVLMATLAGLLISLAVGGWPAISHFGLHFFTSSEWNPSGTPDNPEFYGAAGPIVGTLITALVAMLISLPLAIGIAVFLVEFCPPAIERWVAIAVELLAGIPSIVYGMWGLFVLAPWFSEHVMTPLQMIAMDHPGGFFEHLMTGASSGSNNPAAR